MWCFEWDTNSSLQLSPAIVGGLHSMAHSIECRSYTDGLNIHTHIVSSSNFSETSAFMPVLKVVLTQANKLGVWYPLCVTHKPTSILKPSSHHSRTSCAYTSPVLTDLVYSDAFFVTRVLMLLLLHICNHDRTECNRAFPFYVSSFNGKLAS